MSYQQSSFSSTRGKARSWRSYSWSDPAQVAANQRGSITQEQRALLDKGPGCFYLLVFVLFLFSVVTTLITIGMAGYQLFTSNFMLWGNIISVGLLSPLVITFVLGTLASVLRRVHKVRYARASAALSVERVQGEVIWEGQRYAARTPDFRLTTPAKSPALPPPGPYYFYSVKGQKKLLSVEPIHAYPPLLPQPGAFVAAGLSGDEQARQLLQQALYRTLGFSQVDLAVNRMGMLTAVQRRKLFALLIGGIVIRGIVLVVSGAALGLGVFGLLHGWITFASGSERIYAFLILWGIGIALLAILLLCLRYLTVDAWRRYAVVQHETVQSVEGRLHRHSESTSQEDSDSYYYDIGTLSFEVSEAAYNAIIINMRYRAYYLAATKSLVSIEALEAPPR